MEETASSEIFRDSGGITGQIGLLWQQGRAPLVVPLLKVMVYLCLTMSLMLFIERVYMGFFILVIKVFQWRPEKKYKWEPINNNEEEDFELGNLNYPMVLVQIPMYNEKEVIFIFFLTFFLSLLLNINNMQVYQLSIGAACGLSWPANRIIIQVLDDSTDPGIKV